MAKLHRQIKASPNRAPKPQNAFAAIILTTGVSNQQTGEKFINSNPLIQSKITQIQTSRICHIPTKAHSTKKLIWETNLFLKTWIFPHLQIWPFPGWNSCISGKGPEFALRFLSVVAMSLDLWRLLRLFFLIIFNSTSVVLRLSKENCAPRTFYCWCIFHSAASIPALFELRFLKTRLLNASSRPCMYCISIKFK